MMVYNYIEVKQPIGVFYICSIPASVLINIVESRAYSKGNDGVQRDLSPERTKAVANYCSDPDAVFPTPIVVSVDKDALVDIDVENQKIIIKTDGEKDKIGEVIDGQHRLWGIKKSELASSFNLPVVFMFDLTMEEKAYVFATINSNQKKVDTSLIYQLFDVSTVRTPQRTAHQIARVMNLNEDSPFHNRLKMLGSRSDSQPMATLSQGTFAKSLMMLMSKKYKDDELSIRRGEKIEPIKGMPFRDFFIADRDDLILKVLLNCFNALRDVFSLEWNNPNDNILWKTTGFRAVIYSLKTLLSQGIRENDLTREYFIRHFEDFKSKLEETGITLTSKDFPGGGEQNQKKLAKIIIDSFIENNRDSYFSNLLKEQDFQMFINGCDELDHDDLYDLAYILSNGKSMYDRFSVQRNPDDLIEIVYPLTEAAIDLSPLHAKECLKYLESKYMSDMDYESWYGYIQAVEKED